MLFVQKIGLGDKYICMCIVDFQVYNDVITVSYTILKFCTTIACNGQGLKERKRT